MSEPYDPWARKPQPEPHQPGQGAWRPSGGTPAQGPSQGYPSQGPPHQGGQPPQEYPAYQSGPPPQGPPPGAPAEPPVDKKPPGNRFKRMLRDPLSLGLVIVIVLALVAAGLVGAELYARHVGNQKVTDATKCLVKDDATASFGGATPFLWQYATDHYSNLTVSTAGNQIRDISGMKADVTIDDIQLGGSGDSKGTIGSLQANINWTSAGIKQTAQSQIGNLGTSITDAIQSYVGDIPFLDGIFSSVLSSDFIAKSITINDVKTNPGAGTIGITYSLGGGLADGSLTVTPALDNGELSLKVADVLIGGQTVPAETLQDPLSLFTKNLTNDLPLGVKAKSIKVTDTGVTAEFGTENATIPAGGSNACFADL